VKRSPPGIVVTWYVHAQPERDEGKLLLSSVRDSILVVVTRFLGRASLLMMMVFIFNGPLGLVSLGLAEFSALVVNACLSLGFFVQHSGMIRGSFQRWSGRFFGEKYQGALYTIASSVMLLLVVGLWQESSFTLYSATGVTRVALRAAFLLSLVGFFWGMRSLGSFDAFGLDPIVKDMRAIPVKPKRLRIRGPYRWVRHPLYFFIILMIWSCPDMTVDRLLFNLLWTAWIVVGTILEERDLIALFGEDYRVYQTEAPMIIPNSFRPVR
jgi:methanethiol S-methyltransferase